MAAPGVGVGDLINACIFIYDLCIKYKDAPKEFDEIAEKAKSTAVVLERLDDEALLTGNLVERAGPQAYDQLQSNLASLRRDSEKLQALVSKYDKIHSEGPGRRMLFALKESNGLTDLRQRIGRHEQTLQLWYMTLVYGSLRRLEGGQEAAARRLEDLMSGIDAIKRMGRRREEHVRESLARGNTAPLEAELSRSGLSPQQVLDSLNVSANYVMVTPKEQRDLEKDILDDLTEIRRESSTINVPRPDPTMLGTAGRRFKVSEVSPEKKYSPSPPSRLRPTGVEHVASPPHSSPLDPPLPFSPMSPPGAQTRYGVSPESHFKHFSENKLPYQYESSCIAKPNLSSRPNPSARPTAPRMRRSNSTSARRDYPESPQIVLEESSSRRDKDKGKAPEQPPSFSRRRTRIHSGYPSVHQQEEVVIVPNDSSRRARRSSEVPAGGNKRYVEQRSPRSPLLVVPDLGPQYRSSSAQGRDDDRRPGIEEVIVIERRPPSRPRASSNTSDRGGERGAERGNGKGEGKGDGSGGSSHRRRSSSANSYVRVRPGSSDGGNDEGIRMVRKMDRIDSGITK